MAVSRGFGQFSRRMKVVANAVGENAAILVRKAALAADQAVVQSTPVDTGRARANWVVSIGAPRRTEVGFTDPGGGIAISAGAAVIGGYKAGQGSIFITNSVPYINELEDGSSKQARSGMTVFAIQAARAQLKRGGLLKGI